MRVNLILNLNKDNEAETAYANILDMSYASYNMLKLMDSTLPDITCEACDCGSTLEYRLSIDQELTAEDLEKIFKTLTT